MENLSTTIDWVFKAIIGVFFLGVTVWAVRGWISAKTEEHKASEQPITLGELDEHCLREHGKMERGLQAEIAHVKELIEKDLEHGGKKFDLIFGEIKEIRKEFQGSIKEIKEEFTGALENMGDNISEAISKVNGGPG